MYRLWWPLHGQVWGHSPPLHTCKKVVDNIGICFLEKSRCSRNSSFRDKFGTKEERLRSLNFASFLGNIHGHVLCLSAGEMSASVQTLWGGLEWGSALLPAHGYPGLAVQDKATQVLGTSIFDTSLRIPLRDPDFKTAHFLYQLATRKKTGDSVFIITL